jgi:hypothetical protein
VRVKVKAYEKGQKGTMPARLEESGRTESDVLAAGQLDEVLDAAARETDESYEPQDLRTESGAARTR